MRTIYKYSLVDQVKQTITMKAGAKIRSVQVQFGTVCIWAEVDTDAIDEERTFLVRGTRHPMGGDPSKEQYLGTVQVDSGNYIFHIYEQLG